MNAFVALLASLAIGCGTSYYQTYRAEHPEWDGSFPTVGADLGQTVAALYRPPKGRYRLTVQEVRIFRTDVASWQYFAATELLSGRVVPDQDGTYVVVAQLYCVSEDAFTRFHRQSVVWYLLPGNRLTAYDHYDFQPSCAVEGEFRPAEGDLVKHEQDLVERLGLPFPAPAVDAEDAYKKGLMFLRAGREQDGRGMLEVGDRIGPRESPVRRRFGREDPDLERSRGRHPGASREALLQELEESSVRDP